MSRLPIRVRLTAAFALATIAMLAGAGLLVYARLEGDLDETIDANLRARAGAVAAAAATADPDLPPAGLDPDEALAQVVDADGRVLASAGGARGAVLAPAEAREATRAALLLERPVPGVEGEVRILAEPAAGPGAAPRAVVVGQSLDDRDETLSGVVASFAIGGAVAVAVASVVGYLLAAAGLRPVEAMRRRATQVRLAGDEDPLPLPAARDEVRRLGETLNEMLARLRCSMERERRFVADASHELRTPVAVLTTELEAALRARDLGSEARESLVAAVEECHHLARLAEDLLVLASAADGRLAVRPEALDARTALEGARSRAADRAEGRGRAIRVDAPAGLVVTADPLRLRQALGNLVDNALRHGGGEVVLSARAGDGGVEIDVADAGPGIAPGLGERAFERFARADAARGGRGAGLGLAIVRAIAEAHGGRASIVPAARGARVRLWLPGPPAGVQRPLMTPAYGGPEIVTETREDAP